ncbi:hypothetical protein M8C13_33355 [Crossiella sp. SN42]|uniref:hypothetical protein n=1 Tax=Crossiella sp. SN42 TaxID=2944808 RepID=UPI00207C2A29|nr:hypothetical protein [Crossiella sp. SN42]MCO1580654.1 hypothetical protein [Crossiella sp. SN42]
MSKLKALVLAAASAIALTMGATAQATATPEASAPAPRIPVPCDNQWHQTGTFVGEWISPWFGTSPGPGYTREIQFRATGGVNATRGIPQGTVGCFWQTTKVAVAGQQRTTNCIRPTSCNVSGWASTNSPWHNWRSPGKVIGWDPFAFIWREYAQL